jgi:hypothetical protein
LISWYQGLTSQTREQIEAGLLPVTLEGHASPTGEEPMNLDLSDRRMQNVKKILGQFVGNRAVFHTRAIGRYLTTTPPGVESQEDRTVTISVWDQTFEGEAGWKDIKP